MSDTPIVDFILNEIGAICTDAEVITLVNCARDLERENVKLQDDSARKDKLIEQMREVLALILEGAIHDFHYVCQHRDNCLCLGCQKIRVNAALSAAERGAR